MPGPYIHIAAAERIAVHLERLDVWPSYVGRRNGLDAQTERGCDELAIPVFVHVDGLEHNECRVYRVIQRMSDRIIGGYTIIALRR